MSTSAGKAAAATATTVLRRALLLSGAATTTTTGCYGVYKAKVDPPHIVWDLDETLLYSVCPKPNNGNDDDGGELEKDGGIKYYPTDTSRYFDQIDDDFPYESNIPNTRTYWRPGAKMALRICGLFCVQHVYTAAQGTYTANIINLLDPNSEIFDTVIHRDVVPAKGGKNLKHIGTTTATTTTTNIKLDRVLLFDDRVKNFTPQNGKNGVHVVPYNQQRLLQDNTLKEYAEVSRWVTIALLALMAGDVRDMVVPYFQSEHHRERFP